MTDYSLKSKLKWTIKPKLRNEYRKQFYRDPEISSEWIDDECEMWNALEHYSHYTTCVGLWARGHAGTAAARVRGILARRHQRAAKNKHLTLIVSDLKNAGQRLALPRAPAPHPPRPRTCTGTRRGQRARARAHGARSRKCPLPTLRYNFQ